MKTKTFEAGGYKFELGETRMVYTYNTEYLNSEDSSGHNLVMAKTRVAKVIKRLLDGKSVHITLRCRGRKDGKACDAREAWVAEPELVGGKVAKVEIGCSTVTRKKLLKLLRWAES